jgi:hypothetical protein
MVFTDTGSHNLKLDTSTAPTSTLVGVSDTQTLTNKTLGAGTTFTDGTGHGGGVNGTEGTPPTGTANWDNLWADSTAHRFKMINNNGSASTVPGVASAGTPGHLATFAANGIDLVDGGAVPSGGIANITVTITAATYAANTKSTVATATMTGLTTSSGVHWTPSADYSGVTGWGTTGGLTIFSWPSATNTVSYYVINQTGSSITTGSSTTWILDAK